MTRLALVVLTTLLALAAHADKPNYVRIAVGTTNFCVPEAAVADVDVWWIPQELPNDGFVFQLDPKELPALVPVIDMRGRTRGLVGSVAQGRADQANAVRGVLARRAAAPSAIAERDAATGLVLVYESPQRNHWTAWKLPIGIQANAAELERGGEPIATCSKPAGASSGKWKGSQAICRRHLDLDGVRVGYSMDSRNLKNLAEIDAQLKRTVMGWRCGS